MDRWTDRLVSVLTCDKNFSIIKRFFIAVSVQHVTSRLGRQLMSFVHSVDVAMS